MGHKWHIDESSQLNIFGVLTKKITYIKDKINSIYEKIGSFNTEYFKYFTIFKSYLFAILSRMALWLS